MGISIIPKYIYNRRCGMYVKMLLLVVSCLFFVNISQASAKKNSVLIITSYNPDTERMNANLSEFYDEYKRLNGDVEGILIENMNCKNLSEAPLWKDRMAEILKNHESSDISLVVLFGQEAWAAFLSQTSDFAHHVPVMPAMVSTNTIDLPSDSQNLRAWMPESKDVREYKDFNVVGGIFYKYDVETNIRIIKRFYPYTRNLYFLSDFTFGGLSMQSLVVKEMKKHPEMELHLLDGRSSNLFNVCKMLRRVGPNSVLLVGTWRIDCSENYVMSNTTGVLRDANKSLPAFSMSSSGMGDWVIGGCTPEYSLNGKNLADLVCKYLKTKNPKDSTLFYVHDNSMTFDRSRLDFFGLKERRLPDGAVVVNGVDSFFVKNRVGILVMLSVMAVLSLLLLVSLYYIAHIRKLKEDIEKKREELKTALDKAESANRMKTAFIANMSHEIRTPLNAIVGFSELQAMDDYSKEEKEEFVRLIKENSDLLLNLINEILDMSRIESGRMQIETVPCNLVKLCHNCLVSVRQTRAVEGVEYQESYPVDSFRLKTDETKLKQVIINLLTNASKFTKEGFIRLGFELDEESQRVIFTVTDSGIGIPKEDAEKVFERFVKLNPYAQGTGLGLPLCRVIVQKLGGEINLNTDYTGGSQFVFTIPFTPPHTGDGNI